MDHSGRLDRQFVDVRRRPPAIQWRVAMRMSHAALTLGLVLNASLALSQSFATGTVTVEHPWARATAKGASTGVVYLTIVNASSTGDKLISIVSAASRSAQ